MKWAKEIMIIILVLIIPMLHEVGHLVGYTIDGVSASLSHVFINKFSYYNMIFSYYNSFFSISFILV